LRRSSVSLRRSGVSLRRSGVSLRRSGVSLRRSGVSLRRSGVSLRRSGVSLRRSDVSLRRSDVSLRRSSVHLCCLEASGKGSDGGFRCGCKRTIGDQVCGGFNVTVKRPILGHRGDVGTHLREGGTHSFDFYCDIKNTVFAPGGWTGQAEG